VRVCGKILGTLRDQRGATTVEYALLLAFIALPSIYLFRLLLAFLAEHYKMVVFLETLPMP
jgi:Flp pilus assembly pilin Flp